MLKIVLIVVFLTVHLATSENRTRVERSDKVGAAKVAIANVLAQLGKVAYNQLSGTISCCNKE